MKILCYVNHYFGKNAFFEGKSSLRPDATSKEVSDRAASRKANVEYVIQQLKSFPGAEVKVCGIHDHALVPVDIEFDLAGNPLLLIYESLNHMAQFADDYDYFINIEDDVFLPQSTVENIIEFDKHSLVNEILLPNRLEESPEGETYCVDLKAIPGWIYQEKMFGDKKIRVGVNPHSAILILSREKLKYALNFIDRNFREPFLFNELDSAFAYFHRPFSLYRTVQMNDHWVKHLDNWMYSKGERNFEGKWRYRVRSIKASDFVPPIIVRSFLFLKRKLGLH